MPSVLMAQKMWCNLYAAYFGGWSIYALPWSKIQGTYMCIGQHAWWHICYNICPNPWCEVTVKKPQNSVLISWFVVNTYLIAYMWCTGYKQCCIYAIIQVAYIAYMQQRSWFASMNQHLELHICCSKPLFKPWSNSKAERYSIYALHAYN